LFQEWQPKVGDKAWLVDCHQQSYLVLNVCRILHTVLGGGPGSKRTAARWVKHAYPEWAGLIDEAESWRYGAEMSRIPDTIAFTNFATERVRESAVWREALC
jgi:hypothetical protein